MKFLCDQCKAKYQISDDKVAGKTVRMKCRKCGHQIEVRAAVTETSVSTAFPSELPPPAAAPPAAAGAPPMKPAGAPTAPKVPPAPRPSTLATSLSAAARPAPPRPQQGALAGAFKTTVQKEDEALLDVSTTDEWYVAINGVPVGPVRIAELRRKAALGAVTDESLVWQEGMEEWRIVRQIPELQAIVREAATSGRVSLLSPEPPQVKPSSSPPQSMRPAPMRSMVPRAPQAPPAPGRSNVVPITSRLATAEKLEEIDVEPDAAHDRLSAMPDPFAVPPSVSTPHASAGMASAAIAAPQAPIVQTVEAKKSPPWIILGMLFMFTAFGVTAALVFKPQPQQAPAPPPQVIIVPGPPTAAASVAAAPTESASAAPTAAKPGAVAHNTAPAASASNKPAVDLSGLNTGGPKAPDLSGLQGKGGVAGTSLTQDQIEGVMRSHMLGVRRTCWERGASNSSAANVTATIKINGSGQVTDVSSTGNDPVVGKCIESDIHRWQFPPTGASTTVNIPFHFVRQ